MKKMWLLIVLALFLSAGVSAQKQHSLKLLAVQENADGSQTGSGADLYLELKEGSGRVFLDTFPATKIDTQISTRFAKEIACHYYKLSCDKYDFIYTIKAESNIIGGPSAGAAIAALTAIAVLDLDYRQDIAITGTINSGGIIGPVGGVKEKLEAASQLGLDTVLVAKGTASPPDAVDLNGADVSKNVSENASALNASEQSINLTQYAKENLSLAVMEVSDLDEVMLYLTGAQLNHKEVVIEENQEYTEIMSGLRNLLCQRIDKIENELKKEGITVNESILQRVREQQGKSANATLQGDHYSAASYCFTANIMLRSFYYQEKNPGLNALWNRFGKLEQDVEALENDISKEPIETISDLQTYIIVKERLDDVRGQIADFKELQRDPEQEFYGILSYAEERYFSAQAWMKFFSMSGRKLLLDQEHLQQSCRQKISEAEERQQYVSLYISEFDAKNIKERIDGAIDADKKSEYELCLIKAIQAKGDANAILSVMGVRKDVLGEVLDSKIMAVKRVIAENSAEGKFPILGYSYYRYATSLKEEESYTALVYLEYAMEMSDLSLYFPEEKHFLQRVYEKNFITEDMLWGFAAGAAGYFILSQLFLRRKKKHAAAGILPGRNKQNKLSIRK